MSPDDADEFFGVSSGEETTEMTMEDSSETPGAPGAQCKLRNIS